MATKRILVTHGPYKDTVLDTTEELAAQGMAEGWAKDTPNVPFDPAVPLPDSVTAEETAHINDLAAAAAPKLRGELEPEPKEQKRNMEAKPGAGYETREPSKSKR